MLIMVTQSKFLTATQLQHGVAGTLGLKEPGRGVQGVRI